MRRVVIHAGAGNLRWCCDELELHPDEREITLDLRPLTFVGPLFLVRLRAWLDFHAQRCDIVRVTPPHSLGVRNYLSRMRLTDGLAQNVVFDLPVVRENPLGDRLIPLTRLDAGGDSQFDDLLGDLLRSPDMRHAGYLAEVVEGAAQEMVLNAVDHGMNDVGAYVAAQRFRYPGEPAPHVCVVGVGDMGIGMAAHLERGGEGRESDVATIAHGLEDMVSGTGEEFRGHGFQVPFDLAREKSASWVEVRVRANRGWVGRRSETAGTWPASERPPVAGTWIEFGFAHSSEPV